MFKINSYLQFRNTPDGKPRVLTYYKDYKLKDKNGFNCTIDNNLFTNYEAFEDNNCLAILEDCRPLLTTGVGQECDIIIDQVCIKGCFNLYMIHFETNNYGFTNLVKEETEHCADYFSKFTDQKDVEIQKQVELMFGKFKLGKNVVGSFFDNPAKYSQLLWGCSEEEGWAKIFKILQIEK